MIRFTHPKDILECKHPGNVWVTRRSEDTEEDEAEEGGDGSLEEN